ncbi:uncharacterized protein Tco025E_10101 [Trypanosoma conorhini]|uniref:Uncharacterized protein n=1 Tax=Trypanosoma conorhini TaxID=83891 RepID=A0A422MPZ1_9TRYP|nr:uncharacterized protein Tco025E_10101 [Trypanosoma conorhini]RNE95286.1 hypothetical protein Tco025E_10101 [Trypanosoma conorhini]
MIISATLITGDSSELAISKIADEKEALKTALNPPSLRALHVLCFPGHSNSRLRDWLRTPRAPRPYPPLAFASLYQRQPPPPETATSPRVLQQARGPSAHRRRGSWRLPRRKAVLSVSPAGVARGDGAPKASRGLAARRDRLRLAAARCPDKIALRSKRDRCAPAVSPRVGPARSRPLGVSRQDPRDRVGSFGNTHPRPARRHVSPTSSPDPARDPKGPPAHSTAKPLGSRTPSTQPTPHRGARKRDPAAAPQSPP